MQDIESDMGYDTRRRGPDGVLGPCVANGRLRHMLIGSARVSKAAGSQVVAAQDEGVAQPFLSATPSTDGRGRRER